MRGPTNPYIAGNPITGTEMFFGRQDVFRFVRETLVGRYQDNAIVLYGGRRTGKTTVLYQMKRHLEPQEPSDPRYVPILIDLQGISLDGLGDMLWGVARAIARVLRREEDIRLAIPPREQFASDPEGSFCEGFLAPALESLGDRRLLLMLDEAARLYEQVLAERLEPRVFDLLRSLIQYHPRLNFVFSIGSGLEEMCREYALLFNLCQYRKISFLDRDAAVALITEPVQEHYRHTTEAVERILEVTHGHPYYTQLVCNRLFARWARQGGPEVTAADVDAVLPEAAEQGMASLQYAWEEASPAAKLVLAALAELAVDGGRPVGSSEIRTTITGQGTPVSRRAVDRALHELVTREVVRRTDGGYAFTVDLMRLWLQQYQRLEWVAGRILLPREALPPAKRTWRLLAAVAAAVLCLLLSLAGSWLVGTSTRNYVVPLTVSQSDGMASHSPSTSQATVVLRAPASVLLSLRQEEIHATIDLTGLAEGTHRAPVQVSVDQRWVWVQQAEPAAITVTLEPRAQQEVAIALQVEGHPHVLCRAGEAWSSQRTTTVSGPASLVDQVARAVATARIDGRRQGLVTWLDLEARNAAGTRVEDVNLSPDAILAGVPLTTDIAGSNANPWRTLTAADPALVGSVPSGYSVFRATVEQQDVMDLLLVCGSLCGTDPALRRFRELTATLDLDQVPLSVLDAARGLEGALVTGELELPSGVRLRSTSPSTVTVRLFAAAVEPAGTLTVTRQVDIAGLRERNGDDVVVSPPLVDVVLSGPEEVLSRLLDKDLRVLIDISGLEAGTHELTPVLEMSPMVAAVVEGRIVQSSVQVQILTRATSQPGG